VPVGSRVSFILFLAQRDKSKANMSTLSNKRRIQGLRDSHSSAIIKQWEYKMGNLTWLALISAPYPETGFLLKYLVFQ
jgi:hypothetical protein